MATAIFIRRYGQTATNRHSFLMYALLTGAGNGNQRKRSRAMANVEERRRNALAELADVMERYRFRFVRITRQDSIRLERDGWFVASFDTGVDGSDLRRLLDGGGAERCVKRSSNKNRHPTLGGN